MQVARRVPVCPLLDHLWLNLDQLIEGKMTDLGWSVRSPLQPQLTTFKRLDMSLSILLCPLLDHE